MVAPPLTVKITCNIANVSLALLHTCWLEMLERFEILWKRLKFISSHLLYSHFVFSRYFFWAKSVNFIWEVELSLCLC